MKRHIVTVAYADGRPDDVVTIRPVALVAAERHFSGRSVPAESTLYAAWYMLTRSPEHPASSATFADWLESLEAVEERQEDPTSATPAAPSPPSPSS